jgi:hypothetical protein
MNAFSPKQDGHGALNYSLPNYRSVFISDVHLGMKECRSDFLAHFLGSFST